MISRKKKQYPASQALLHYMYHFGRQSDIPLIYNDLLSYIGSIPYENPDGEETLWLTVFYPPEQMAVLRDKLTHIYAELKIGGDSELHKHLEVERIDLGEFGNSRPFRICITNQLNDNSDYFYVKVADASRLYGLELEHILSPNRINYLINGNTLIEDHVAGVPGDVFLGKYMKQENVNRVRIAKEFTKFNERCFIRLLGDMRSVNYVVDITPDFEQVQYRVRPIDFDQQCYMGKSRVYHAYNFRSNREITRMSFEKLDRGTIYQYAVEERSQMARRATAEKSRLAALFNTMRRDRVAPVEHVRMLGKELDRTHRTTHFSKCPTMGELTARNIEQILGMKILKKMRNLD